MKYISTSRMREIDRNAIEKGVPAPTLMENAGRAVAEEISKAERPGRLLVMAGYGNNGGDGFVVARILAGMNWPTRVFLCGREREFSPETAFHYQRMVEAGVEVERISAGDEGCFPGCRLPGPGVIVDAVFGIGVRAPLPRFYRDLFETINSLGRAGWKIFSVDVPSGLDADTGEPLEACVRADCTVTMGYPKKGFRYSRAAVYLGRLVVADIGLEPPG